MESKRVSKGNLMQVKADIYYQYTEGKIVIHYTYPKEYIFISNTKGEAKIYYPSENKVYIKQNDLFSIENELLFYFFANRTNDLGLKDIGFSLAETKFEDNLMISSWNPPANLASNIGRVEMVHEEYMPIYTAYYSTKNIVVRKTYYYDYQSYGQFYLPEKITEISYTSEKDSIVSRKIYSDVKMGNDANNSYFNYTIPKNAKITN